MIRTSRLTSVVNVTAQTAGNDARVELTTVAYRSGCSATVKTIVGTDRTNCQKTVQNVTRPVIFNVKLIGAFRSE